MYGATKIRYFPHFNWALMGENLTLFCVNNKGADQPVHLQSDRNLSYSLSGKNNSSVVSVAGKNYSSICYLQNNNNFAKLGSSVLHSHKRREQVYFLIGSN